MNPITGITDSAMACAVEALKSIAPHPDGVEYRRILGCTVKVSTVANRWKSDAILSGVELEREDAVEESSTCECPYCEGCVTDEAECISGWTVVDDCSLSCEGVEYVSDPYPWSSWLDTDHEARTSAEYIQENIGKASRNAGLHVHIGIPRGFYNHAFSMMAANVLMEHQERIAGLVPRYRLDNGYSEPCDHVTENSKYYWMTVNSGCSKPHTAEVRVFASEQPVAEVFDILAPAVADIGAVADALSLHFGLLALLDNAELELSL